MHDGMGVSGEWLAGVVGCWTPTMPIVDDMQLVARGTRFIYSTHAKHREARRTLKSL